MPLTCTASPGNITVVSLDWDSVSLLWDPPPAGSWFVDSYRVVVASGRDTRVVTSAKPRVRVDRLKQLTNYWVNVEAGNKAGYGPPMHSFLRFVTPGKCEELRRSHNARSLLPPSIHPPPPPPLPTQTFFAY